MSPRAGGRQAPRQTVVRCRKCGEYLLVTPWVAYGKKKIRCHRCGGAMRPTSAGGKF